MSTVSSAASAYRVSRGDELNFRFPNTPELNTVITVRSDGQVALPYAGELAVEGLSMAELAALVEARLAAQVRRPQVVVNVQGATPQRVFVGGEVGRPGVQPLLGPLTALQAVMVAEGLKESAQPREVLVLRRGPNEQRQVLQVNLAALMDGKEGAQDVALQPFDVVIVPRSGIASLNVWVDQYIRRTIPISFGFSYSINRRGCAMKREAWTDTLVETEPEATAAPEAARLATLRGLLTIAFYDRRRIGAVLLLGLLLTTAATLLATKKYTAEASLLMRLGREYIYTPEVGDSSAGSAPIAYDREQSLQAETKILTSRDLEDAVLKKLGIDKVYPEIAARGGAPEAQHRAALLTFEKSLDAELLRGSNLMQINFTHRDPVVAATVLTQLLDSYLQRRSVIFASANYESAAADFAARQNELRQAEARLAAGKGERRVRSFGEEQSLLLAQRNALEMRQSDMNVAVAQTGSRGAALRGSLPAVLGEVTLSSETQRSDALENARKVLLDLTLKERDLSARFTDENPLVLDARAAVERTRQFVHELEANPTRTVRSGRSPTRDAVETDLVRTLADQSQARAGDAAVAAERARVEQRLAQFAISEQQLPALERSRRLAEQNYEAAAKRLRDETALAELDRQRRSNVSVVQSPQVPLEGKSARPAIATVGVLATLCAALLTAFLSALWRDTFLTPEEVERRLGVKLLATVPVGKM